MSYSSEGGTSSLFVHAISCIWASICKMATPMALKTNHIWISALRLKNLTRSDLEGLQLLLMGNKLIPVGKNLRPCLAGFGLGL